MLLLLLLPHLSNTGLNNDFLEATLAEPAVVYSGQSPNEMFHAAAATKTLMKEENNFLVPPATVTLREIRAGLNQAILGTDLKVRGFRVEGLGLRVYAPGGPAHVRCGNAGPAPASCCYVSARSVCVTCMQAGRCDTQWQWAFAAAASTGLPSVKLISL